MSETETRTGTTTITVHPDRVLGEVSPLLYGHFTEHLANIVYDGLWSEKLYGRKFEAPMTHRSKPELAAPWRPFGGNGDASTSYPRGAAPIARYASPQAQAHHAQAVVVQPGTDGSARGLTQDAVVVSAGTSFAFRASVRRVGGNGRLRIALRSANEARVLAEAVVDVPPVTTTRFGRSPSWQHLWMDDQSWMQIEATLTPSASDADGTFTMTFEPAGDQVTAWWFDWVSLQPRDNTGGWHAEVVRQLRELPVQLLKWPGGCMADDYDWRYGIGPRDRRYGSVDQAWATWDENDVGTDEFVELCRLTGAEPVVGVNAGTGDPALAAAWVEYSNGPADSQWGRVRAANGHSQPYGVRYWAIGNEQWGFFERGYAGAEGYAERYLAIAEAMRRVDPTIVLAAVGHPGDFNRAVLSRCASHIDLLQIHFYTPEVEDEVTDIESAARKVRTARAYDDLFAAVRTDLDAVEGAGHISICLDEWGWARAGHAGAVFAAAALNAMHRAAPLVSLGARSAVINVDGVLDRAGETVERTALYDVFRLYGLGHRPVAVEVESTIDASCLRDPATGSTTLYAVNDTHETQSVTFDVPGVSAGDPVVVHEVVAADDNRSDVRTTNDTWRRTRELPPVSLTVLQFTA